MLNWLVPFGMYLGLLLLPRGTSCLLTSLFLYGIYLFINIFSGVHAQFFEVMAITKMQLSAISRWIPAIMGHFPAINSQCGDKSGDKS